MRKHIAEIDRRHQLEAREIPDLHGGTVSIDDYWRAHHHRDVLLREVRRLEAKVHKLQLVTGST